MPFGTYWVALGDFNGDGKLDIVADGGGLVLLLGKGDGTFGSPTGIGSFGEGFNSVTALDVNGDGKLDLLCTTDYAVSSSAAFSYGTTAVLLGNGDGTFQSPEFYATGENSIAAAVDDFNGNHIPDLAVVAQNGQGTQNGGVGDVAILLGNGDGTFQASRAFLLAPPNDYGSNTYFAETADLNHDGNLDLVVSGASVVSVLLGNGDGTFKNQVPYNEDTCCGEPMLALMIGDFNNDGNLDIADVSESGFGSNLSVLLGYGDGAFDAPITTPLPYPYQGPAVAADFNGDGNLDVAMFSAGQVQVILGYGDGTFHGPSSFNANISCANFPLPRILAADFNGDGKQDVAVACGSSLSILLGNGDGTLQAGVLFPFSAGVGFNGGAVVADFNHDGKLDIAATAIGSKTGIDVFLGNGDGTFQSPAFVSAGSNPQGLAAGDFYGAGNIDLIAFDQPLNAVDVLQGNGDGTFQPAVLYDIGGGSVPYYAQPVWTMAVGDFNNDHALDIAVPFQATVNSIEPLLNQGPPINPGGSVSPGSLPFGNQTAGTTSPPQQVTLTSTGTTNLLNINITITGANASDFAQTNNCPSSMAPGTQCTINVTFTPSNVGAENATLDVNDNAANSPQTVALSGTGVGIPVASVAPTTLTFASQDQGTTSAPQPVTLSNTGTAPLTISSIAASGDFAEADNCSGSVAAGGSCTVNVTFTPTGTGTRNGTLTVTDNSNGVPGSQQTVTLTGTGINPGGSVSPSSLAFGSQVINTTSSIRKVTLTSNGTTPLMNISVSIIGANAGDFAQTNNCPSSIAPGTKCTINVTFTPSIVGAESATLDVNDNAANSPQTVALSGTGVEPATLTPATSAFGNVAEDTPSTVKNFTLRNNQPVALNSIAVSTNNPDYTQTNTCGSSLAAHGSCTISVTLTPSILGADNGTLSVSDSASNSPQTSAMTGTGVVPATLTPTSENFGNVPQATPSATKTVTLHNFATVPLSISSITTGNADFTKTDTCDGSVPAKSTCTITLTFTPSNIGVETGTLSVADSAVNSPQTTSLTGTGIAQATVSPTSLTFAAQKVGTTSTAKNVTLTNNLTTSLTFSGVTISGTNAGDFASPSNTCGGSLAAKSHCTISVTFKPTATGTRTATMDVNDSANNSPQTVSLTGTGK